MEPIKKSVTQQEFEDFIKNYPRPLEKDCYGAFEPPLITYNDFELADKWPYSVVAYTYLYDDTGHYYVPENKRKYFIIVNYEELFEHREECKNNDDL